MGQNALVQTANMVMVETIAVTEIFVTELGKIEQVSHSCYRFYFCTVQDDERHVVAKLIFPADCLARIREQIWQTLGAPVGLPIQIADQLKIEKLN